MHQKRVSDVFAYLRTPNQRKTYFVRWVKYVGTFYETTPISMVTFLLPITSEVPFIQTISCQKSTFYKKEVEFAPKHMIAHEIIFNCKCGMYEAL